MGFFKKIDKFLFGGPGEVGGVIGTKIDKAITYAEKNPGKALLNVATLGSISKAERVISTTQSVYNYTLGRVSSPAIGSVVYCDLAGTIEHSGIYIGNNLIAHLDGSGRIEAVSPNEFLGRLGGFNPAVNIYVSCNGGDPIGSNSVARRAKNALGGARKYNIIFDNCHQFSAGCITGNVDNACNFLWMLQHEAEKEMGVDSWRVWDR